MHRMNYEEFEQYFRDVVMICVTLEHEQDGQPDFPARREYWNNVVDMMGRNGELADGWEEWDGLPIDLDTPDGGGYYG